VCRSKLDIYNSSFVCQKKLLVLRTEFFLRQFFSLNCQGTKLSLKCQVYFDKKKLSCNYKSEKSKIKNQVIKFVNNTKSILVAQNFLNAVADTVGVDTFQKCPPLHSVKNFEVFPDILALSFFLTLFGYLVGSNKHCLESFE
jgi:hypothetical protein